LKTAIYDAEHEEKYDPEIMVKRQSVHDLYRTSQFDTSFIKRTEGLLRIAFVREPSQRILSAYANRVIYHKALEKFGDFEKLGLNSTPSVEEFILKLPLYRSACHEVRHHTDLMTLFLGPSRDLFDRLLNLSEIEVFYDILEKAYNKKIDRRRRQFEGPKLTIDDLSSSTRKLLISYCAHDYDFLGIAPPKTGLSGWSWSKNSFFKSKQATQFGSKQKQGQI
jgi:hypothetical protein